MSLCFPFQAKERHSFDFITPVTNFIGNAFTVSALTVIAGAVSYFALKALGFSAAAKLAAIASTTIAAIGVAGAVAGVAVLAMITVAIYNALSSR
ncbi:MAG: hypothetical protein ACHQUC_07765 [Chlamydiales bacterium]